MDWFHVANKPEIHQVCVEIFSVVMIQLRILASRFVVNIDLKATPLKE
jgi:hypothetical protein